MAKDAVDVLLRRQLERSVFYKGMSRQEKEIIRPERHPRLADRGRVKVNLIRVSLTEKERLEKETHLNYTTQAKRPMYSDTNQH